MSGLQYFAIGAGAAFIVIVVVCLILAAFKAIKRIVVWASGKLANLFFGSVPGGRK